MFRSSTRGYLRIKRISDQFHFARELRKGPYFAIESLNNAGPNLGGQELKRQVYFPSDSTQHGPLLLETRGA